MKVWNIPCNSCFTVTYPFGVYDRNLNKTNDFRHHGTDIVIDDKKVISASVGKVIFAGWNNDGYGNLVMVQNGEYVFYYAHLKSISVSYGQEVNYLTQIGVQGATGYVTGEHLHFEVRRNGIVQNSSNYMKIPNEYGRYNPEDYSFDLDKKKVLHLSKDVEKWRIYPLGKSPVVGNECGYLLPSKFGGLSYEIQGWSQDNVAIIDTRDFGRVQIYCGRETSSWIE